MKLMFLIFSFLSAMVLWAQTPPTTLPVPSPPTAPPPGAQQAQPTATEPGTIPSSIPVNIEAPPPPGGAPAQLGISMDNQATALPPDPQKDKFFYDPTIGRDPFRVPMVNIGPIKTGDIIINEDSLEGASIPEGVRVLAIIYDPKRPRALVEKLANKKSYLVFNKSRLGIGGGVVSEIREDEIVVVRSIETDGQTNVEHVILRLNEKKKKNEAK